MQHQKVRTSVVKASVNTSINVRGNPMAFPSLVPILIFRDHYCFVDLHVQCSVF